MKYTRMPIEVEAPEEYGYDKIKYNLSESSCTDRDLDSLGLKIPNLTLLYKEHRGSTKLREYIVGNSGLSPDDVLVTSGAAGALFIIATSQLTKDDHLVVMRPNYATNIETPRSIGCQISYIDLQFSAGFQSDLDAIKAELKPKTKLISVTCPHNPTGTVMSLEHLHSLADMAKAHGCLLLVDETYRDVSYSKKLPIAASLGDHIISVSSMSKSYGIPGIRLGWLITRNKSLQETFLAAKEQISITGSVIDEWIAEQVMSKKDSIIAEVTKEMTLRRDIVDSWIRYEEYLDWNKPEGGTVCFAFMKREPVGGTSAFYERLLNKYATYVGPGHWFEMPDTYFRIGFGWPTVEQLRTGLGNISKALRDL